MKKTIRSIVSILALTSFLLSFASCKKSEVSDSGLTDSSDTNSASDKIAINDEDDVGSDSDELERILSSDELKTLLDDAFSSMMDDALSKYGSIEFLKFPSEKLSLIKEQFSKAGYKTDINSDGVFVATKDSNSLQFGGQHPDNEFTQLLSFDFGKMLYCFTSDDLFSSSFFITEDDLKSFIENVKKSDFNQNVKETPSTDNNKNYFFEATNNKGVKLHIQSANNNVNIVISK